MQRARQAPCCIWMVLADWIERCLEVKEDSKTPTFKRNNTKKASCMRGPLRSGGPLGKPEITHSTSRPYTHPTDTKTIFLVIKHTSANADTCSHETHTHTHTILFMTLLVICSLIFLQNGQIVLFIPAQLSSARTHTHTLWAMSTCSKLKRRTRPF